MARGRYAIAIGVVRESRRPGGKKSIGSIICVFYDTVFRAHADPVPDAVVRVDHAAVVTQDGGQLVQGVVRAPDHTAFAVLDLHSITDGIQEVAKAAHGRVIVVIPLVVLGLQDNILNVDQTIGVVIFKVDRGS